MKAYSDRKTVYISDFIKQKHKQRRVKQLMQYVSTAERQIVKLSSKDISNYNWIIRMKAESNHIKAYHFYISS